MLPLFLFTMSCIDRIVTLGMCPDEGPSKSSFTLMNAPGISPKVLESGASESYVQGVNMAMAKKSITLAQVRNDFIGALQAAGALANPFATIYDTAAFNTGTSRGTFNGERGINITRTSRSRGRLKYSQIDSVEAYPLTSGAGVLRIYADKTYTYNVTFTAGQINVFNEENLDGFPLPFTSPQARIVIEAAEIEFASSRIICGQGCGGSVPNPCGYAEGINGATIDRKEGFGLNVRFSCPCNYDQILCDLGSSYMGEIIWLKWRYNVLEEIIQSNRFNYLVIYNRDEQNDRLVDLDNQYRTKWNEMMGGLKTFLQQYKDDKECIVCNGIRWAVNV